MERSYLFTFACQRIVCMYSIKKKRWSCHCTHRCALSNQNYGFRRQGNETEENTSCQNVNSKSFNDVHFSVIIFGFWSFICFNSSPKKNLNFVFIFSWSSISFFLTILFYCICTNNVIELRVEIFIKCHSKTGTSYINWVYAKMEKIWNIFLKLHSNIQIDAIFIIQSFHRKLYLFVIFFPAI